MSIGKTVLGFTTLFVGVFAGHMIVNGLFFSGSNRSKAIKPSLKYIYCSRIMKNIIESNKTQNNGMLF